MGSLGERYGYVPAVDEYFEFELDGVKDDFPWLKGVRSPHIPTGLGYSLTELEFLYSMLHAPRQVRIFWSLLWCVSMCGHSRWLAGFRVHV